MTLAQMSRVSYSATSKQQLIAAATQSPSISHTTFSRSHFAAFRCLWSGRPGGRHRDRPPLAGSQRWVLLATPSLLTGLVGEEEKWYGTHTYEPGGQWNSAADVTVANCEDTGHPAFRASSALDRGFLKKKITFHHANTRGSR